MYFYPQYYLIVGIPSLRDHSHSCAGHPSVAVFVLESAMYPDLLISVNGLSIVYFPIYLVNHCMCFIRY